MPMSNFNNVAFSAQVQIGTPPQAFDLILDVGNEGLLVYSQQCGVCSGKQLVRGPRPARIRRPQYNPGASSTFAPIGTIFNQSGFGGVMASDTVDFDGVALAAEPFGMVTTISTVTQGLLQLPVDGVAGLAPISPFLQDLFTKSGQTMFSFFFSTQAGSDSSEFTLGGADPSHYTGELQWTSLIQPYLWMVPFGGVQVGGASFLSATVAVFDTQAWAMLGPSQDIVQIALLVGAQQSPTNPSVFGVECSAIPTMPNIALTIGGQQYELTPQQYVLQANNGQVSAQDHSTQQACVLGMISNDVALPQGKAWILGTMFQQTYFTAYDWGNRRVGLAPAVQA
jgi:hypothetical protein